MGFRLMEATLSVDISCSMHCLQDLEYRMVQRWISRNWSLLRTGLLVVLKSTTWTKMRLAFASLGFRF